jgi:mRNA interferase RelE/StbE
VGRIKIEFSKQAAKDYKRIPDNYKVLIDLALQKLSNGIPVDIKPIIGEEKTYRIRVGKYRIIFIAFEESIVITKIGSRGDIYK